MTTRPDATEYEPHYAPYVALVPDGEIITILTSQLEKTLTLLRRLTEDRAGRAYAPGKWTIKEVLGHITDAERILAYRALCIARKDKTPLPGFEQDDYVAGANFNAQPISGLIEQFEAVRRSNLYLFGSFTDDAWKRRGTANGKEISTRALAYNIAGHELHHVGVLNSRYLAG